MALLELRGINRFYGKEPNRVQVLKEVDLSIERGDFIAIIGQSGSGKTTLMNILGCLDTPSSGLFTIEGVESSTLGADQLAMLRRKKFGFIFQRYNLLASLSARENTALPAVYSGQHPNKRRQHAELLLAELGLAGKEESRPNELSGGQQQRVSIARALMNGGEIILADEPTGALDSESGKMVMDILKDLHKKGHTIILVTHDTNIAACANRIVKIHDGKIVSDSKKPIALTKKNTQEIFTKREAPLLRDQFFESLRMSIHAIYAHKLRSLLTILGIIIGIASVVSMVALGKGSQEKILNDISSIGTNTISIFPGRGWGDMYANRIQTLTLNDAQALTGQQSIDSVSPQTDASGTLTWRNKSLAARLQGVGIQFFAVEGLQLQRGRFFNEIDVNQDRQVVVIDHNTHKRLFPGVSTDQVIGQTILFRKRPLIVIGVAQKRSGGFGQETDQLTLWAPYTTVMHQITGAKKISSIMVKVAQEANATIVEQQIIRLLKMRHGKEDFFTFNSDTIKKTVQSATNTMTLFISSIAVISLIVGGIGVMNIMLVSVTERTNEIGIRMAIGAQRSDILQQFLIEAVLLCLSGGLAGVILSWIISLVFNSFVKDFVMNFSMISIIAAVCCSTVIGVVFGFMPARNAAHLNPIEALSRE